MDMDALPLKYHDLWLICRDYLSHGQPGDLGHAEGLVFCVLQQVRIVRHDIDVLVPAAMLHDIGHSKSIPSGLRRDGWSPIPKGNLASMFIGWRIAFDLLESVEYDPSLSRQIVDLIGMHEADRLSGSDWRTWYDTPAKKMLHDLDVLSCSSGDLTGFDAQNPQDSFFFSEIRRLALEKTKNDH